MGGACSTFGGGIIYTGFWLGNLRERHHLENPCVGGRIILRWIFRKWDVGTGLHLPGSGWERVTGTCECGKEPLGSKICGEFLD